MKKTDLERLVTGVKTPPLDRRQTWLLADSQEAVPLVAQPKTQSVAQSVAQGEWVAQNRPQPVAQVRVGHIQSLVAANEVEAIKVKIAEMAEIEDRKTYLKSIGITIKVERRSKGYYFYGVKKIDGKKERFYCGRVC